MIYPDIQLKSAVPLYLQIKRYYRRVAALGILSPHEKLPSVRDLAGKLGINPNTVHKAFSELEHENVIYAVPGKGYFLCERQEGAPSFEREEMARLFQQILRIAWTTGCSAEELHELLDETIRASEANRPTERPGDASSTRAQIENDSDQMNPIENQSD